jgi:hypothetical protein
VAGPFQRIHKPRLGHLETSSALQSESGVIRAFALTHDIENLGIESTGNARDLLEHNIANSVCDIPQLGDTACENFTGQFHLAIDIKKLVLHLDELAVRRPIDLADQQIVLGQNAPVAVIHFPLLAGHAQHIAARQGPELAHLLEIVHHNLGNVFTQHAVALPGKRDDCDGHRIIDPLGDLDAQGGVCANREQTQ